MASRGVHGIVMDERRDASLAAEFASRYAETRSLLLSKMEERGLLARDGWRIHESTRTRDGRTELVLRPMHAAHPIPEDLECVVSIDEPGTSIESHC